MPTALAEVKEYSQLSGLPDGVGPYLYTRIFQDTGAFAKRRMNLKFRILRSVDVFLEKILKPEEKVFFISYGLLNNMMEQIFLGAIIGVLNRKAFIFTSTRIILIQLKGKDKTWDLKSSLDYGSIAELKKTWTGQFKIKLNNGKTLSFSGVPKGDRKFISGTVQGFIDRFTNEKNRLGTVNLCPECGVEIDGFPGQCPACSKQFKDAKKAGRLSLLFPGLGDYYLGHKGLAALEILGAGFVWFGFLFPDPEYPMGPGGYALMLLIGFLIMHVPDSFVTRYIGKKGIYPA